MPFTLKDRVNFPSARSRANIAAMISANDQPDTLRAQLQELRVEHRDLDEAIDRLENAPPHDDLLLRRLKKRKLHLKDRITQIEGMLEPDIPA